MDANQRYVLGYPDRPLAKFDQAWLRTAHALLMRLINIRTRDSEEEWQDFMELFRAGKTSDMLPDYHWPTQKTEAVLREWRMYRDMTRLMVQGRFADWVQVAKWYPPELVERASARADRGPFEKIDKNEIHEPIDAIWIALTFGRLAEVFYRMCAACERFLPATYPKRKRVGRPPIYCAVCAGVNRNLNKRKDLDRHLERKKTLDEQGWEIVRRALQQLPKKERAIAGDEHRRRLANRLFELVKKDLAKVPGKRGARWIAKKLKGVNHE